jgi:hypothetical protein
MRSTYLSILISLTLLFSACLEVGGSKSKRLSSLSTGDQQGEESIIPDEGCTSDDDCKVEGQVCDKSGEIGLCIYQVGITGCTHNSLAYGTACSSEEPSCCDSGTCIGSKCACGASDCAAGTSCNSSTGRCETGNQTLYYGQQCVPGDSALDCAANCSANVYYNDNPVNRCGCKTNSDCYGNVCNTSTKKCTGTKLGGDKCSDFANDTPHCSALCKSGMSYHSDGVRFCSCALLTTEPKCINSKTCGGDGICR